MKNKKFIVSEFVWDLLNVYAKHKKGAMASSVDYEIFAGSGLTVKGAIDAVADSDGILWKDKECGFW